MEFNRSCIDLFIILSKWKLFIEWLFWICCYYFIERYKNSSYFSFVIHDDDLTILGRFWNIKGQYFFRPNRWHLFSIFLSRSLKSFFSNRCLYPTVHISKSTSFSTNWSSLEPKACSLGCLLLKLRNNIDKACLLSIVVNKTSKLIFRFFKINNRI